MSGRFTPDDVSLAAEIVVVSKQGEIMTRGCKI
jgi:hypothetical protein